MTVTVVTGQCGNTYEKFKLRYHYELGNWEKYIYDISYIWNLYVTAAGKFPPPMETDIGWGIAYRCHWCQWNKKSAHFLSSICFRFKIDLCLFFGTGIHPAGRNVKTRNSHYQYLIQTLHRHNVEIQWLRRFLANTDGVWSFVEWPVRKLQEETASCFLFLAAISYPPIIHVLFMHQSNF